MNLSKFLNLENPTKYKLHTARHNGEVEPLNVFLEDRERWNSWNSWQGDKDEFNRQYIVSLIRFYPEADTWLFGGIYEVLSRGDEKQAHSYNIQLLDEGAEFIGRLKIKALFSRGRAFLLENCLERLTVTELLKEVYSGEKFIGYENISLDFNALEVIYKNERLDWKTALENVKGIYVIVDKLTGKKYVGSAYGETGVWSRWGNYMATGHGWNVELVGVIADNDINYARKYFRITLIECWPFRTDDSLIKHRESFWKNALLTRGDFGYNSN